LEEEECEGDEGGKAEEDENGKYFGCHVIVKLLVFIPE
jgi:hypothetical protein